MPPASTPLRILIIEDDTIEREEITRSIGDDVECIEVATGAEAREFLEIQSVDCVLLDYRLPDVDGITLLKELVRDNLPVIILTNRNDPRTALEAGKLGAKDYLLKSLIGKDSLLRSIKNAVEKNQLERRIQDIEARLHLAMTSANVGVWDWNIRTNEVYASPQLTAQLGYGPGDTWSGFSDWRNALHPNDHDEALDRVNQYINGEIPEYLSTFRLQCADGSYRWILSRGSVERDEFGEAVRMIGVHIDIHEQRLHEDEMEAARKIQDRLIPQGPPDFPKMDIAGDLRPAAATAGDFFDYLPFRDGSLGIAIGDVTGHGLGPSLIMSGARQVLRSLRSYHRTPGDLLTAVNNIILPDIALHSFVTLFLAKIDAKARTLDYAGAGHEAYLLHPQGGHTSLLSTGFPLGIDNTPIEDGPSTIALNSGQILLLFTDGLSETESPEGIQLRTQGVVELAEQCRHLPAAEIIECIHQGIADHRGIAGPQEDDMTLVVAKIL